jgi:hypothetical protein
VLGDQAGGVAAALELRSRDWRHFAHTHTSCRSGVGHQRVVAVVHQCRDDHLVDRDKSDRVYRRAISCARHGGECFCGRTCVVAHKLIVHRTARANKRAQS